VLSLVDNYPGNVIVVIAPPKLRQERAERGHPCPHSVRSTLGPNVNGADASEIVFAPCAHCGQGLSALH